MRKVNVKFTVEQAQLVQRILMVVSAQGKLLTPDNDKKVLKVINRLDKACAVLKVGDKVKVLNQGSSYNPKGSVGRVSQTSDEGRSVRVIVKGCTDDNMVNSHDPEDLKLIKCCK
jgi:hypothetical protein